MAATFPILIVSGPPGAGKSAVSRELVKSAQGTGAIYIEGDAFRSFIARGAIAPTTAEAREQNIVVTFVMVASARVFARRSYDVVLDFTIGPWLLSALQPALREVALDYVLLRPSMAVCAERVATRVDGRVPSYDRYADLYEAFATSPDMADHTIDDNGATPASLASRVRALQAKGKLRIK